MIVYLRHHQIDKVKWDSCIDQAQYSIMYGYSWYLDITSPGWDALVEDDYISVFPLTWKRKYGIYYLAQPRFSQQLGIFSRTEINNELILAFLNSIPEKFTHYDLYLNPLNNCQAASRFRHRLRKTYHINLAKSYDQIFQNYSNDTKRNLKKYSNNNLVYANVDVWDIVNLYKKNVWYKTPGLKLIDFNKLDLLSKAVSNKKQCITIGVYDEHILCAGAMFFICADKIIFIFGSATKAGRRNGAMRLLFDRLIRDHSNRNLILDFEGSSIHSVEYFYKGFGSDKITFFNVQYSKYKLLKAAVAMKQRISKQIAVVKIKAYLKSSLD